MEISQVGELLKNAKRLVVLTGAGMSKESGIPTFRETQKAEEPPGDGADLAALWANYDPQKLATPEGFLVDPTLVWRWYEWRRQMVLKVEPNAGHVALAKLEKYIEDVLIVTQNVDGLHARAGSRNIVELHGSITSHFCFANAHKAETVPFDLPEPPECFCGSPIRPAVVWFGEALPQNAMEQATRASESCDLMLVVGTSALVWPAASLPYIAKQNKAKIIEINPESTPLSDITDYALKGTAAAILPRLLECF